MEDMVDRVIKLELDEIETYGFPLDEVFGLEINYDNKNRLTSIKFNNDEIVRYTYDENDLLIEKTEGSNNTFYKYDSNGKLININDNHIDVTYEYDNLENIEQKSK